MQHQSPFDMFDPDRPGWLKARSDRGQHIAAEDVARIVELNPELVPERLVRNLIVKGLRSELKMSAGRPKRTLSAELRIMFAAEKVDVVKRWFKRAEARGYSYAKAFKAEDPWRSLSEFAHELVARKYKFRISGKSLRNEITRQKNRGMEF